MPRFPEIARFENEYPHLKWNLLANLMDGALYAFGMSFVALNTVLPVLVEKIGGSNIAIGLITVVWTLGFNFPQIFVANYVQKYEPKKRLMLATSIGQRIPWLLLGLICFFLIGRVTGPVGLVLFFVLFGTAAIGGSINLTAWFSFVMRITPVRLRGRLFAARGVSGAILGVLGGFLVEIILSSVSYPDNFGILFLTAFLCMMLSYLSLSTLHEGKPRPTVPGVNYSKFFKDLPRILAREKNFRNFMIWDSLLMASTMAGAFYIVHAIKEFSLSYWYAGTFTVVNMVSMIAGDLLFGFLADRFGHKVNLLLAGLFAFAAAVLAILAPSVQVYFLVFVFWTFMTGLNGVSRLPVIAEISPEHELPTHIALANMIDSPFALTGILAGFIANVGGYNFVFGIAALFAILSVAWLFFMFDEPRKKVAGLFGKETGSVGGMNPFAKPELRMSISE